jgi:hypothetical protein
MAKNVKQTSPKIAAVASAVMRDKTASKTERSLGASLVAQARTGKETGKAMETKASKVLSSDTASARAKSLAASVTSQANKKR